MKKIFVEVDVAGFIYQGYIEEKRGEKKQDEISKAWIDATPEEKVEALRKARLQRGRPGT